MATQRRARLREICMFIANAPHACATHHLSTRPSWPILSRLPRAHVRIRCIPRALPLPHAVLHSHLRISHSAPIPHRCRCC